VELADLETKSGEWLRGDGAETDVVMSSRIRLARNLAGFPFTTRATDDQKAEILARAKAATEPMRLAKKSWFVDVAAAPALDARFLVERHLVSRELAMGKGARGAAFGSDERISVMVNEEDHLRIQAIHSGLSLQDAWEDARRVDVSMEQGLPYAVSPTYGYLTACPTNVGTGLRASVMLHLPALVTAKQIDKVFQAASRTGLAVRGFYGEGTMASGDFYQISNQVTLGVAEEDILRSLERMLPTILEYERKVRRYLLADRRTRLEDKVHRALAILRNARMMASEEAMELLSAVRLGVVLGIADGPPVRAVNELFVLIQPAHLQKQAGRELESDDRDALRASLLRKALAS
jgi:protein arginine kinase